MREKAKLEKFISYFDGADTFALLCHVNPDSDTLGSALALRLALQKTGKQVCVFCDDKPPVRLAFMPTLDAVNQATDIKKFDVCVAIDCSDADRFNLSGKYFKHAKTKLVLDHHKTNDNYADYTVCVPEAAATAELVYDVIRLMEAKSGKELIDYDVALLLFAAIVGDSGGFSFSNTTSITFAIASELMKYKIPNRDVVYKMIKAQPVNRYNLKARALSGTKFYEDNKIGIMTFRLKDFEETGTTTDYTEGIINELVDVNPVLVAYAVSEVGDKYYKVSIRTKAPIDAAAIATVFGGGGHERAAGCRLSGFYEDVVDKLLKAATDLM